MSRVKEKLIFAPGEAASSSSSANTTAAAAAAAATDPSHQAAPAAQAAQFKQSTLHRSALNPSPSPNSTPGSPTPPAHFPSPVPETCTLSTAHLPSGRVSSRMVYLKELDSRGFVIYSNWGTSQKARDFATNRHVALCFWWKGVERQVRVEGVGERLTTDESQIYFDTRARGSRLGAWASRQSEVLIPRPAKVTKTDTDGEEKEVVTEGREDDGRAQLEEQVREIEDKFAGHDQIPVPDFWGGLRVIPDMVEFWQGRESRLHDRFRYQKVSAGEGEGGGEWKIERLNP
ncbi:hypothetical protein GJ744_002404 [Endocarpon pusillum]|uniref:pyridoxal 5'-phosphate synthase n=1 Tax=Endocarpon pusillum TaxID=364733 RepID=A0A8H7ASN4_9EURO|nr:hypothetical protein GJ744_002404 [Endocarpon pusillum]